MRAGDVADHEHSSVHRNAGSRPWIWLSAALGPAMALAIVLQLGEATGAVLATIARLPPLVWLSLLLLHLSQPLFDFVIFRRLWGLPPVAFEALLRKNVINEVVLGYSGDAYFYAWARRTAKTALAPFAAIKDAAIVSALLGNLLTVALSAISAAQLRDLDFVRQVGPALWSGLIPLAISIGVMLFGRRVFSLGLDELAYIAAVGCLRLTVWTGLTLLIWRMALPNAPPSVCLVLLAIRCLVSRIPLISNKDLVFGNLVLLLLGAQAPFAVLLAALALVMLLLHLVTIAGLGVLSVIGWLRARHGGSSGVTAAEASVAHD